MKNHKNQEKYRFKTKEQWWRVGETQKQYTTLVENAWLCRGAATNNYRLKLLLIFLLTHTVEKEQFWLINLDLREEMGRKITQKLMESACCDREHHNMQGWWRVQCLHWLKEPIKVNLQAWNVKVANF